MNPLRFLPRIFFTVTLFVAVPLVIQLAGSDKPAAKVDCDQPLNQEEQALCGAEPNLERAVDGIRDAVDRLDQIGQ